MISGALLFVAYLCGVAIIVILQDSIRDSDKHPVYSAPYRNEYKAHCLLIIALILAFLAGAVAAWGK